MPIDNTDLEDLLLKATRIHAEADNLDPTESIPPSGWSDCIIVQDANPQVYIPSLLPPEEPEPEFVVQPSLFSKLRNVLFKR